jgi:cytochrome c556
MTFMTKALIAGFVLSATVVFAGKSTDPDAMARQTLMGTVGMNTKVLGEMAGGKIAFDAAAAEAAKAALTEAAGKIAATFEPQGTDAESKAKPDIWTNWEDFLAKADGLAKAASALDATTVEGLQAGMAGVGGACKDCHSKFQL